MTALAAECATTGGQLYRAGPGPPRCSGTACAASVFPKRWACQFRCLSAYVSVNCDKPVGVKELGGSDG